MSKTKQDKREVTFASGASVPGGTVIYLTGAQAHDRGHLVRPVKDAHKSIKDAKRLGYVSDKPVFFKAGETVELEGEIDRGVALAVGDDPAPGTPAKERSGTSTAEYANGVKAGRAEMLKEIEARNEVIDAAEAAAEAVDKARAALEAEVDADKKASLQPALDKALAEQHAADAAVNDLPQLKA